MTSSRAFVIEERGPGWFRPVRPVPYRGGPGAIGSIRAMRRSLISVFTDEDYRTGTRAARLLGRQTIVANEPDSIKYVMVTNNENFEQKSPQMRRALEHLIGDGLFISDGETWKKRRPLVNDIVHRNRIPEFAAAMELATAELVSKWAGFPGSEPFDVLQEMAELTAEIIARTVFGQSLGSSAARDVVLGFSNYQRLVDSVNIAYFLGYDDGWPVFRGLRLRRATKQIHGVINSVVNRHLSGDAAENSMLRFLTKRQSANPELGLDTSALRSEAATLFMAGHETTAATLAWAWYCLANAPWIEEAIVNEIETVVGSRAPTVADVPYLKWCRATIEEILRLYPPVPILPRQAKNADSYGAVNIEAAALVIVVPWLLHRSPDLWDRPHDFRPERFLGPRRPEPYSYVPFATGPRVCPGQSFGLTEATLCLASIAQRFKVRIPYGHRVDPYCRLTLRPRDGLPVFIEPRK
jgi:cytochrome P450